MEITWLGHACFRLKGRDVTILTDPYGPDGWGYGQLVASADVVTVSNDHPHHSGVAAVEGKPRVLRGPGEYEIGGTMIWGVRTPGRPESPGAAAPRNTSYIFQMEDLRVCHLGDLGQSLSTDQLAHLKDADVLLVPVGGHCTIDAAEAAEVIAQVEPKVIVPMHYATAETEGFVDLEGVERFCEELGAAGVTPQPRLTVAASSLPAEPTVVLLEPRK